MPSLVKEMISNAENGIPLSSIKVSRFSPTEIRLAIKSLMDEERDSLAYALGDAGLALYPESEDILAVTSLLSVIKEDWTQAIDLLKQLLDIQGDRSTVFTYSMLIRSLRCNLDLAEAFEVAGIALNKFPSHPELLTEYDALAEVLGLCAVKR
tara:strand:+ start:246 stop:704 length:459 start_codon:yes stop_codon:yes gene_type:complete